MDPYAEAHPGNKSKRLWLRFDCHSSRRNAVLHFLFIEMSKSPYPDR